MAVRVRDVLVLMAVAAWVALILENFATPPPAPPAVPYAAITHHGAGPH